jgi:Trk-type K+ transport system membrane component
MMMMMMMMMTAGYLRVWPIFFELVSAFGTVGFSFGYPGTYTVLSHKFSVFSKLMIILVMMAGRHRGLPDSVDPAVRVSG